MTVCAERGDKNRQAGSAWASELAEAIDGAGLGERGARGAAALRQRQDAADSDATYWVSVLSIEWLDGGGGSGSGGGM